MIISLSSNQDDIYLALFPLTVRICNTNSQSRFPMIDLHNFKYRESEKYVETNTILPSLLKQQITILPSTMNHYWIQMIPWCSMNVFLLWLIPPFFLFPFCFSLSFNLFLFSSYSQVFSFLLVYPRLSRIHLKLPKYSRSLKRSLQNVFFG